MPTLAARQAASDARLVAYCDALDGAALDRVHEMAERGWREDDVYRR